MSRLVVFAAAFGLITSCTNPEPSDGNSQDDCPEGVDCVPCPEGYTCFPEEDAGNSGTTDAESDTGSSADDTGTTLDDTGGGNDDTTPPGDTGGMDTADPDTGDNCPALPDPPGDNVVDLGDEGLSDGDTIDPYLEDHLDAGNEVHIPEGTYDWNGEGFDGDLSDRSVVGDGNVTFDTGGGHTFDPTFNADGAFEIRNITVKGKASGEDGKMRIYPTSDNAKIVARNFNQPDGSEGGNRNGMYVPRDAQGEAWIIDCHVEGFSDNGLYASSPGYEDGGGGAEIHVRRGLFKNNNISGVRVGSTNSSVIGTVIVNDAPSPPNQKGKRNQRGLRFRAAGDDIHIENVDIIQSRSSNGAVAYKLDVPGGSGEFIDTRIQNDISNEAIDVPSEAGEWTGDNVHITGDGDLTVDNIDITNLCQGDGCDTPRSTARSRCP